MKDGDGAVDVDVDEAGVGDGDGDVSGGAAAKIHHRSMYESLLFHECRRRRN